MADVTLRLPEGYTHFFIEGDLPDEVLDEIDLELSYEDPEAQYKDSYKDGTWDGRHRLLRTSKQGDYYFPVGLLGVVTTVLDVYGVDYTIRGLVRPGRGNLDLSWNTDKTLWDHQQDAVEQCLDAGCGLVVIPTGGGKTFIGIRVIYELRQPAIVFCHQQEIATQWVDRLESILDVDVARCFGGTRENGDIMVALYQSVYDDDTRSVRDDVRLDHEVGVWDEAHRVAASTFSAVSLACSATYRYGLTATKDREDNAGLKIIGGTGPVIADLSVESLIEKGILAEPHWDIYDAPRAGGGHYQNWRDEYKHEIVRNAKRNQLIADIVGDLDKPTLVTVERINHGERLEGLIDAARFVHGDHSDRGEIIGAFRDGLLPVMIATRQIVGEGFDVEAIRSFVVAGGMKSELSMIQQVGRALRPGETGEATIVDFLDRGRWISGHSESRLRTYQNYYQKFGPR